MKRFLSIGCLAWLIGGTSAVHAEGGGSAIPWPAGVEAKIGEAVAIKKEAFKLSPRMRTSDGMMAGRFGRCMDEVAAALLDKDLRPVLLKSEATDLNAKIALWALDRKARPGEYTRVALAYVDAPPPGPPVKPRKPLGQITRGRSVADSDLNEDHRWMLEYSFFAPPAGKTYDTNDGYRGALADALAKIGNDSSLYLFEQDLHMQLAAWPPDGEGNISRGVGSSLYAMHSYRNARGFQAMAVFWPIRGIRNRMTDYFIGFEFRMAGTEELLEQQRAYYKIWQELANRQWETEAQRDLAAWIKKLPPVPDRLQTR